MKNGYGMNGFNADAAPSTSQFGQRLSVLNNPWDFNFIEAKVLKLRAFQCKTFIWLEWMGYGGSNNGVYEVQTNIGH